MTDILNEKYKFFNFTLSFRLGNIYTINTLSKYGSNQHKLQSTGSDIV